VDVSRFLWRSVVIAAGLAATATAGSWSLLGAEFALGVALGTAVAHASFVGLARDLSAALGVAAAQGHSLAAVASAPAPAPSPVSEGDAPTDAARSPSENGEIPPSASDPAQAIGLDGARQIRARSLLKWPLVGLALAGILWYMPARPEGVALGVVLSLAAAVLAALFEPRAATSPEGSPEGPTAPPPGD
jgi:hypothetical protein